MFSRLPVFPWISIKRCERSHFPPSLFILLKLWRTGKSAHAAATATGKKKKTMMVALWTYRLYAQTGFAVCMSAGAGASSGSGSGQEAETSTQTKERQLFQRTEQNRTWFEESSHSPAAATGFYGLLCARPSSAICFPGNQSPVCSHLQIHMQPTSKILLKWVYLLKEHDACGCEVRTSLLHDDKSNLLQIFLLLSLLLFFTYLSVQPVCVNV